MDAFQSHEIVSLSYVWSDRGGHAWLVTFDLAELDGRAECVGMSIRSYLALPVRDPDNPGGRKVWVEGPVSVGDAMDGEWLSIVGETRDLFRLFVEHDPEAVDAGALAALSLPQMLRAVTLRELPFADVLERVRRHEVAGLKAVARGVRTSDLASHLEAQAEALNQPRSPSGRHKRYLRADLERVAAIYRAAHEGGSRSPTKDVAEALGMPRSQAAKLVMRCREPHVKLLYPTVKSKAGGTRPPQANQGPSRTGGQDSSNQQKEE